MPEFGTLLLEWRGDVAVLTLDRPESLNAINQAMHAELKQAFDAIEARSELRGLIVTGAGRGFCAGQDLSERKPLPEGHKYDLSLSIEENYIPLITRLTNLGCPTIALVNGVAAGAGASLAVATDMIVATKSARFILAFSKIGLGPDAAISFHLPQRIGSARAKAMMMTAAPIDAATAKDWGLIWEIVPDEGSADEVARLCKWLNSAPTAALRAVRSLVDASGANDLQAQMALEAQTQKALGYTEDYTEGVSGFLEKRAAKFVGR